MSTGELRGVVVADADFAKTCAAVCRKLSSCEILDFDPCMENVGNRVRKTPTKDARAT
jgi:hypothetical protein